MRLPQKSIGSRLLAMSALSSSFALLLACAAFLGYELVTFRKSMVADLTGDANAIAYNVTAPLLFDDPKAAAASLEALNAKPAIHSAVLRGRDGRVFATYGEADAAAGPQLEGVWHRFERDRLLLGVPVMSDGTLAGTLTLEAGLEQRDQRIRRYLLLSGAVLLVTLLASLGISTRLHRRIVRPITGLTEAAEQVSRNADYSVRVETPAEAELRVLATTFNEMLAMIEQQNTVLRASEARFKGLSESGIIGIVVSDLSGRLLEVNDAFLHLIGLSRWEFESQPLRLQDLTPPDLRDGTEVRLEQIKVQGTLRTWEKEYQRRDGGRVEVLVGAAMLADDKVISFILDVTERKRLEQVRRDAAELTAQNSRIKEANRLKSEFLANMSHELRTPLNAILGFGELLYDGVVPPESPKHREFLGDILKSGRHLLQLINDVLDLAKIEAGKLDFRPEPINLQQLLDEVTGIVRSIAISKGIRIEVRVDASLKDGVFLDPARLKQIVYNFVSNALKFTPRGGSVEVRALPEGDSAFRLEVEDTGPGIAPEDLGKLFVEFQQLDAGTAKQHSGTGLGLALTRRLAEAQGGAVGVRSTPGQGSVFHAVLPRRGSPRAPQPQPQPRAAKPPG